MHTRTTIRSVAAAAALTLALAACGGSTISTSVPSIGLPTLPPNMASGATACLDAETMAIIAQLQATGADAPALLEANKDKLIAGLNKLDSGGGAVTTWRDALVDALEAGDFDAAAAQVGMLAGGEVTLTPC